MKLISYFCWQNNNLNGKKHTIFGRIYAIQGYAQSKSIAETGLLYRHSSNRDAAFAKIRKKVLSSDFYELRVSVDNEIRVILFSADNPNISLATEIIVLNGFVKKSNKDYDKQIKKAYNILTSMI